MGAQPARHAQHDGAAEIAAMKEVFSRRGLNIAAQNLQTDAEVGYVVIDAEGAPEQSRDTLEAIRASTARSGPACSTR